MGQDVRNDSRFCQIPQGSKKGLNLHLKPNPILVAVSLSLLLMTGGLVYYWTRPLPYTPPPPPPPPPEIHAVIAIEGDADFAVTAQLEGWPGDGSPENPYIIDGLDIVIDGGHLISISNTRVSFTISNCNLTGGCINSLYQGAGIYLENVTNGELVNNICSKHSPGILLYNSSSNTIFNNTCTSNIFGGINLEYSDSNTVANNTCSDWGGILLSDSDYNIVKYNTLFSTLTGLMLGASDFNTVSNNNCSRNGNSGIALEDSNSNTVAKNICNGNGNHGISLQSSDSNTVSNNTCNYNNVNAEDCGDGIYLYDSDSNMVLNNTCNYNRIGIYLSNLSNIVADNTCLGNTEYDIFWADGIKKFDPIDFLSVEYAGTIILGGEWRMLSGIGKYY